MEPMFSTILFLGFVNSLSSRKTRACSETSSFQMRVTACLNVMQEQRMFALCTHVCITCMHSAWVNLRMEASMLKLMTAFFPVYAWLHSCMFAKLMS
jgi:hypothetical protein